MLLRRTTAEFDFNSIPDLAVELDARDVSAGGFTSINSRVNGYTFTGTATRDTAINGMPTVSFNGSSDILTSTANISQINGATAITIIGAYQDLSATSLRYYISNGPGTSVGQFVLYWNAGVFPNFANGHVGYSQFYLSKPAAIDTAVWTTKTDFTLSTGAANFFRKNGVDQVAGVFNDANNVAGVFGNFPVSIGAMIGGPYWSSLSFTKICIYARALTGTEITNAENATALLSNITF
jgi:hypothetical protein